MSELKRCKTWVLSSEKGSSQLGGVDVGRYPLHHFKTPPPSNLTELPLKISFAGGDNWIRGCRRYRKNSDTFSLEFVGSGSFHYVQNGSEHTVEPGNVFVVQMGMDSEMRCEVSAAFKRTVSLEGPLLPALLTSLNLDSANVITLCDPAQVEALFMRAAELLTEPPDDLETAGALLGCELLFTLANDFKPDKLPDELSRIIRHLERNIAKQISIEALAREFNMSPASLHRLFKRHLGDSPINYLLKLRMEAARQRLDFSHEPIKMVAFQVGYSNPLYFSTEFRRLVGESPRNYRQRKNH